MPHAAAAVRIPAQRAIRDFTSRRQALARLSPQRVAPARIFRPAPPRRQPSSVHHVRILFFTDPNQNYVNWQAPIHIVAPVRLAGHRAPPAMAASILQSAEHATPPSPPASPANIKSLQRHRQAWSCAQHVRFGILIWSIFIFLPVINLGADLNCATCSAGGSPCTVCNANFYLTSSGGCTNVKGTCLNTQYQIVPSTPSSALSCGTCL